MKTPRKSSTARKPPIPSESHAEIDEWMRRVMPDLAPIVREIDGAIRGAIPDLRYAVKWKRAYYGLPTLGWLVEVVAYDVSVNVVFLGGIDFAPPPPLGTIDRSRYVKVTSLEQTRTPEMRGWIDQAARVRGWG